MLVISPSALPYNRLFCLPFSILFLTFCCGCLPAYLHSQEDNILQIRTISIPPYGIKSEDGFSGIYYDLANTLAKESGYAVSHNIYPYARIIHELKFGKTDLTIMFKYRELEDHVVYIAPLPSLKNVVIGLQGNYFPDIKSLKYKNIAYYVDRNSAKK